MKHLLSIIIIPILFSSFTRYQGPAATKPETGTLNLSFENYGGDRLLHLNTDTFTNAQQESFTVTLLQYFVSNISLTTVKGEVVTIPVDSSYFLVKESDPGSKTIKLNIPKGEYSSVTFMLGVDSLRNTMPLSARTGVLDPSSYQGNESMYWGWNSGYIFFKMEGNPLNIKKDTAYIKKFRYHIGLFGGMNTPTVNNIKMIRLDLGDKGYAKVAGDKHPTIHIKADVLKMFTGVYPVSIAKNSTVMVTPFSANVANNYANMFTHTGTE